MSSMMSRGIVSTSVNSDMNSNKSWSSGSAGSASISTDSEEFDFNNHHNDVHHQNQRIQHQKPLNGDNGHDNGHNCDQTDHSEGHASPGSHGSGLVTTHSSSAVITPGSKQPKIDPLQFVKITSNELCKKVRIYEYVKTLHKSSWS